MKKKILFFSGGSYVSGLEVVTLHLIKGLIEKGYDIRCVMNGWNDGNFKQRLEELGVQVYEIKIGWLYIKKPLWTLNSLIHYPKAYIQAKKVLKEFKPDICQFCNFGMAIILSPLIKGKYKTVFNLQETHLPNAKHRFLFGLLNKEINFYTAVSNHIVRVLQNVGVPTEKIKLVYNGIPSVNSVPLTESNLHKDTILNFAIIGQVVPWKGHSNLLGAVEKLVKEGITNFKVQVFGNDTTAFSTLLKKQIEEKKLAHFFEWKGFVKDQDSIYANCAVAIVPSLSGEPCSLSIIESMSRGRGLIVSDRGGNPELVQHNENGLVFVADDQQALANAMKELINDRNKISLLAEQAKAKAARHYTYHQMTDRYIDIYNEL